MPAALCCGNCLSPVAPRRVPARVCKCSVVLHRPCDVRNKIRVLNKIDDATIIEPIPDATSIAMYVMFHSARKFVLI